MSIRLSGPMFEPSKWGPWESLYRREGAHYNQYGCRDEDGMEGLRGIFKTGEADEMNLCLFSTSGIHGMYTTIEEAEETWRNPKPDEDGKLWPAQVTFLVVQPRICCLRHGNCRPNSEADFAFLKKLRASSWREFVKIGAPESET